MKLAVTGGRDYDKKDVVAQTMWRILSWYGRENLLVVNGMCGLDAQTRPLNIHPNQVKGADGLVYRWCLEHGVETRPFYAYWSIEGRAAGPKRNKLMCYFADRLLSFPGGNGTANCSSTFSLAGKPIWCVDRNGEMRYFAGSDEAAALARPK